MPTTAEALETACRHHRSGRLREAEALYRQILQAEPNHADALHLLGVVAHQHGRHEQAVEMIGRAIALCGDRAAYHSNLADAYRAQGRFGEAIARYRQALALDPKLANAHFNLGLVFFARDEFAPAIEAFRQALAVEPNLAVAHYNVAAAQKATGDLAAAERSLRDALAIDPNYADAHYHHATLLLGRGDYTGWSEYEWRWKLPDTGRPPTKPAWTGEPLDGRTIMLHVEQGLGDVLQFIRYASLVKARGGTVILYCRQPLIAFLSSCRGIDRFYGLDDPLPRYDVQAALMSLPGILQTDADSIPADVPYLSPPPGRVEHWRQRLPTDGRLRVGINWQGNPKYRYDRDRSMALAEFAPLAEVEGVRLFSLQKGPGAEQLSAAPFAVEDLGSQLDNGETNLCDAAAVIKNLDLVVTSDTAVAHLAGALGAPVWVALSHLPDWRWGFANREDSPWYPTMRLFRRQAAGSWKELFVRMAGRLEQLVERRENKR
jgi:Tfp pilus assembly protein PilF